MISGHGEGSEMRYYFAAHTISWKLTMERCNCLFDPLLVTHFQRNLLGCLSSSDSQTECDGFCQVLTVQCLVVYRLWSCFGTGYHLSPVRKVLVNIATLTSPNTCKISGIPWAGMSQSLPGWGHRKLIWSLPVASLERMPSRLSHPVPVHGTCRQSSTLIRHSNIILSLKGREQAERTYQNA